MEPLKFEYTAETKKPIPPPPRAFGPKARTGTIRLPNRQSARFEWGWPFAINRLPLHPFLVQSPFSIILELPQALPFRQSAQLFPDVTL